MGSHTSHLHLLFCSWGSQLWNSCGALRLPGGKKGKDEPNKAWDGVPGQRRRPEAALFIGSSLCGPVARVSAGGERWSWELLVKAKEGLSQK